MVTSTQETSTGENVLNGPGALIHPMSESDFFEHFYGLTPFCTSDRPAGNPIVRIEDLVARVRCLSMDYGPDYTMARNGELLSPIFLTSMEKNRDWLLKKGWTLGINGTSNGLFPLYALGRQLSDDLKREVNTNIYYTPANSQGYDFHCDHHDALVWQQSGRKAWKVYEQGDQNGEGDLVIDTVLEPGQVL